MFIETKICRLLFLHISNLFLYISNILSFAVAGKLYKIYIFSIPFTTTLTKNLDAEELRIQVTARQHRGCSISQVVNTI